MTKASGHRPMLKLLRLIGADGVIALPDGPGMVRLEPAAGGKPVRLAEVLVSKALSAGLAEFLAARLMLTPAARAFMRRAILDQEHAFGDQHRQVGRIDMPGGGQALRLNMSESPLAAMARLKNRDGSPWLSAEAVEAGERLAADFQHAGLQPRITASWQPIPAKRAKGTAGHGVDFTDSVAAARTRVARAAHAMGPELSGVVLDICCFMKGLELVERERQWPARSAKLMLRIGLLALYRHYHP